jgi:neutral ceramidase
VLARAIVFQQGKTKYALAQADLGGLPYALVQEVGKRIAATGSTTDRLLLSATHTHSSIGNIWPADNSGYAFVGGDAFDPRTFEQTADGIAKAIIAAASEKKMRPARVGVGTTQLTGASRNREYEVHLRNSDLSGDPAQQRAQSIDPTVTVVRVDDDKGAPIAVWSNFAIHPTSFGDGNLLLSGDNAGVAARLTEQAIERASGKKASDVVNVWTNSAEGDTSPAGETAQIGGQDVDYTNTDASKAYLAGARTSEGIVRAWRDAGDNMTKDPGLGARRMFFSFDGSSYGGTGGKSEPVGPYPVLGAGGIVADEGQCAPVDDTAGPGQGEKFPLIGGPGLAPTTVPVSFWRVGRLGIAALPTEITKQMGQRIRDRLLHNSAGAFDRIAIAGLTNAYLSYTATPEEYGACSYEGSFTLMGREEGYAWLAAGDKLMRALVTGGAVAGSAPEPPELAFGTTESTPTRTTPQAGTAVTQPAADVPRYGRAVFSWKGGDPQVDAARGKTFVALQRDTGKGWETVGTEDGFYDTTQRAQGDVWTETFQMDGCRTVGTYRFHVTGRAVTASGGAANPYTVDSRTFTVSPLKIDAGTATVSGGVATVRPLYPSPGDDALIALPRLVRGATVVFTLSDGRKVTATDADGDGAYTANVGSAAVTGIAVTDACGNTD